MYKETEARSLALDYLIKNNVDIVWQVDSDEFYTLEEIEAAFKSGDQARIDAARAMLEARSAVEMQILGALDLVGRG